MGSRGPQAESVQAAIRTAIAAHGTDRAAVLAAVAKARPDVPKDTIARSYRRAIAPPRPSEPATTPPATPRRPPRKVIKVDGYDEPNGNPPARRAARPADPAPGPVDEGDGGPDAAPVRQPGAGDPLVTRPLERVAPEPKPRTRRGKKRRRGPAGPAYGELFGW